MTNRFGTTDDWASGDAGSSADMLDTLNELRYRDMTTPIGLNNTIRGVIAHSVTNYSVVVDTAGDIYNSTDSGVTWTSKNTSFETEPLIRICRADLSHGFAAETGVGTTQDAAFTDDSGATWTSVTGAPFGTFLYDISFTTAALIVLGGDDGGGAKHIVWSDDDGATWTDAATSPSAKIFCVDMFDVDTGYAVDTNGLIWKTVDSAVTWNSTTDSVIGSSGPSDSIRCVSADIVIYHQGTGPFQLYTNSTNTVTLKGHSEGSNSSMGIVKTTNGTYYIGSAMETANVNGFNLFRSDDAGVTWSETHVGLLDEVGVQESGKSSIAEMGTDNLIIAKKGRSLIKFKAR